MDPNQQQPGDQPQTPVVPPANEPQQPEPTTEMPQQEPTTPPADDNQPVQ